MAGKRQIGSKIAEEYLERWPDMATRTLAKKMYKENPSVWSNDESARTTLRRLIGTTGNTARKEKNIDKKDVVYAKNANKMGIPNPFHIPESDEVEWPPFVIPKLHRRILILSDIHMPYHNEEALRLALGWALDQKIEAIVLNGDILDFYGLSRYEKDPRKRRFSEELEMGREFLAELRKHFDGIPIYYKLGNHEERYEAYLRLKAPELLDVNEFKLDVLLRFGEMGITLIDDQQRIMAGDLCIMHGHEFGRSVFSPVNPARGYYNRAKASVICGHNHQTSQHSESNLHEEEIMTWSTGCLCELHPRYMRVNKWNHGFAYVEVYNDGTFDVSNLRIKDGRVRHA